MESSATAKVAFEQMNQTNGSNSIVNGPLSAFLEHFGNLPDFDRQVFANLYEDTNEDTVIRILAHFNENLSEGCLQLNDALKSENAEVAWKLAHKIAGSAELLGFKPYGDRSRQLSKQIRANPIFENHRPQINAYLTETSGLNLEIERVFPSLRSFL